VHACVMIPRGIKMNLYMEFMNQFRGSSTYIQLCGIPIYCD
jgi:hypothetical protein